MRNSVLSAVMIAVSCFEMAESCRGENNAPEARVEYSTPQEAFDAFRGAFAKNDWRTILRCQTPRAARKMIHTTLFECQLNPRKEIAVMLEKFGGSMDAHRNEFERRLAELKAKGETNPDTEELMIVSACAIIKDHEAFIEAANNILSVGKKSPEIGTLTECVEQGDSAKGKTTMTTRYIEKKGTPEERPVVSVSDWTVGFKKIGDSWLIDSH